MKITNKYDMLEAMDGINEEYVRRADKLLEIRRAGGEVNRAEITPIRFSWKSVMAAAACLAVLVGGTFGIKALMSRPQIDNPAEVRQAYLNEMKSLFGSRGSVDFARNKLDIAEYDISGFDSAPAVIDKNHAVVAVKDNKGYPELRLHDLESGEQTVLYSHKNDPEITSETDIDVLYANKDYVVFDIKFYAGATLDKRELRVAEINGNRSYTAYTMYGVGVDNRMVIVDDTLYFNTYIGENKNNEIYRYRIGADEKAEKVVDGYNLRTYNGKVYYYTSGNESGLPADPLMDYTVYINFHVLDGELPFDTEKYSGMLMAGKSGIFVSHGNEVFDCVNDKALLSDGTAEDLFAIPLDSMLLVKADNNKAVYDPKTGELLVFEEDDGLYNTIFDYNEFDGGMYTVKMDNDAYSKLCVITEKGENTPEVVDPRQQYLNEMKVLFGAQVNVAYARDRLNIVEFDVPEGLELSGIESKSPIILADSNRIIVKRTASSGDDEVAAYLIDSGEYVTLHGIADNPALDSGDTLDVSICYANKDYVVFLCNIYRGATMWKNELRVVELDADSNGSHRWYTAYSMEDGSAGSGCVIIGNDLYFNVYPDLGYNYYNAPIYRYEIGGSKKPEQVAEGGTLATYNGELYYYRENDDYVGMSLFSLNGELPYDTDKHGVMHVMADKCGIFYSWNHDGTITDCVTDKVILSGGSLSWMGANAYDFLISIGDYYNRALYNTNTDELLVFDKNDPLYTYDVVMSGFDGGACGYSGGRDEPVKLYIITEKAIG